jgi:hypothetical protein
MTAVLEVGSMPLRVRIGYQLSSVIVGKIDEWCHAGIATKAILRVYLSANGGLADHPTLNNRADDATNDRYRELGDQH